MKTNEAGVTQTYTDPVPRHRLGDMSAGARTLVLFHRDADGFGSAVAAWMALGEVGVRYVSVQYDEVLPKELEVAASQVLKTAWERVIMVDFSYPRELLLALARAGREVLVIDHHASAAEALRGIEEAVTGRPGRITCVFDMERAGCALCWEYFAKAENRPEGEALPAELFEGAAMPWLLRAVADRDLWKFAEPMTREICARLELVPWQFPAWQELMDTSWGGFEAVKFREEGKILLMQQQRTAQAQAKRWHWLKVRGHAPIVACNAATLGSETAHALLEIHALADVVAVYAWEQGGVRVSVRARGTESARAIAERYGGGGHEYAAGFFYECGPMELREKTDEAERTDTASPGALMILAERMRQMTEEGFDSVHDDMHTDGKLAMGAKCYAEVAAILLKTGVPLPECFRHKEWPWDQAWFKPGQDPVRMLVKGGALMAAELDKVLRGREGQAPIASVPAVTAANTVELLKKAEEGTAGK